MKQKKNLSALLLIAVVVLFSAFNLSLINKSNHISDTSLAQIEALAGDDPSGGESGNTGEGESGGGGESGDIRDFLGCIAGGKGSISCSLSGGVDVMGNGGSAGCDVGCESGGLYYACCTVGGCYCRKY